MLSHSSAHFVDSVHTIKQARRVTRRGSCFFTLFNCNEVAAGILCRFRMFFPGGNIYKPSRRAA